MNSSIISQVRAVVLLAVFGFGGELAASTTAALGDAADAPRLGATLTVVGGDNQKGTPGSFNVKPFDIAVWNAAGTEPLVNTEVTFSVQSGGGLLAATKDAALPSYTLTLKTDEDGTAQAYYQQPFVPGLLSQIKATAAGGEILLQTTALAYGESPDGDSGTTGKQSSGTKSGSATGGNGSSIILLFANGSTAASAKSSGAKAKVAALTGLAAQVVVKTPNANYAVNTSTWSISTYSGQ
jgi:hypothetical protein